MKKKDQLLSSINFAIKALHYSNYLDFTLLNILRLTTGFTSPMASKLEYRRPGCKVTCAPWKLILVNTCIFSAFSFKTIECTPLGKSSVRSADSAEFFSSSYEKGSIKLTWWLWTSTDYNHFHQKTFLLGRGGLIQPTKESIKVKRELEVKTDNAEIEQVANHNFLVWSSMNI